MTSPYEHGVDISLLRDGWGDGRVISDCWDAIYYHLCHIRGDMRGFNFFPSPDRYSFIRQYSIDAKQVLDAVRDK